MVIYIPRSISSSYALHLADLLRIVLVVLLEHGQQGQTQVGVAHLLRRDIPVCVAYFLIRLVDAKPHLVQYTVSLLCHEAAACQLAKLHVPHFSHVQLAA